MAMLYSYCKKCDIHIHANNGLETHSITCRNCGTINTADDLNNSFLNRNYHPSQRRKEKIKKLLNNN